ncbi:DUF4234 domain-containing protein [Vibrio intestinalis]|uniref:DUF4234 domain-containing protein n=1 Tax=Vibrio intestinalis TaxID=2933291 RepID=UPI0021A8491A|nr:DUF4234 domain-containing protein [Vibrio intestinalis]
MDNQSLLNFRSQSTWRLLALTIITLGVYSAYYIRTQTRKIDQLPHGMNNIGSAYTDLLLGLAYISLLTGLTSIFIFPENVSLGLVDSVLSIIVAIMQLVWGFKARNRLNVAFQFQPRTFYWFHGFWTFMFTPLYFNYKINCICDQLNADSQNHSDTHEF